ncbi:glycosyltransferase [Peribacillus butanolivorans]|uniref:glycosyltransferase family protein n=1 Tax=Peribacillus butanolivorans TaxID=421767 RepID=UPI003D2BC8AD
MNKIKLLYITKDESNYIVPASAYFIDELSKYTDLRVYHQSGNIDDIIGNTNFHPEFIYIHGYGEYDFPYVTGLKDLRIPFGVGLYDLHYNYQNRKQDLLREEVKYVFTCYRDKFLEWFPDFSQNMRWFPHHVSTDIYKDYGLKKDIDLLMMGSISPQYVYPLRENILIRFKNRPEFVFHGHPGYRNVWEEEKKVFVGKKYAMEINRAKIFLTCDSIYKYPVNKYFEITACNTLLLAPLSDELFDLGFIPGVNFVSIDENNFEEKAYYYLQNEEERKVISLNGMRMAHEKHSTKKRVQDFIKLIKEILIEEQNNYKNPK